MQDSVVFVGFVRKYTNIICICVVLYMMFYAKNGCEMEIVKAPEDQGLFVIRNYIIECYHYV